MPRTARRRKIKPPPPINVLLTELGLLETSNERVRLYDDIRGYYEHHREEAFRIQIDLEEKRKDEADFEKFINEHLRKLLQRHGEVYFGQSHRTHLTDSAPWYTKDLPIQEMIKQFLPLRRILFGLFRQERNTKLRTKHQTVEATVDHTPLRRDTDDTTSETSHHEFDPEYSADCTSSSSTPPRPKARQPLRKCRQKHTDGEIDPAAEIITWVGHNNDSLEQIGQSAKELEKTGSSNRFDNTQIIYAAPVAQMRGSCDRVVSSEQPPLRHQSPSRERQADTEERGNVASRADSMEVPESEGVVGSSVMMVLATDCHLADELETSTSRSNNQRSSSYGGVSKYPTHLESDRNFRSLSKLTVGDSLFHANENSEEAIRCTTITASSDTVQENTLRTNLESTLVFVAEPTPHMSGPTLCIQENYSEGKLGLRKRSSRNGTRQPLRPCSAAMLNIVLPSEDPQVQTEDDLITGLEQTKNRCYDPSSKKVLPDHQEHGNAIKPSGHDKTSRAISSEATRKTLQASSAQSVSPSIQSPNSAGSIFSSSNTVHAKSRKRRWETAPALITPELLAADNVKEETSSKRGIASSNTAPSHHANPPSNTSRRHTVPPLSTVEAGAAEICHLDTSATIQTMYSPKRRKLNNLPTPQGLCSPSMTLDSSHAESQDTDVRYPSRSFPSQPKPQTSNDPPAPKFYFKNLDSLDAFTPIPFSACNTARSFFHTAETYSGLLDTRVGRPRITFLGAMVMSEALSRKLTMPWGSETIYETVMKEVTEENRRVGGGLKVEVKCVVRVVP